MDFSPLGDEAGWCQIQFSGSAPHLISDFPELLSILIDDRSFPHAISTPIENRQRGTSGIALSASDHLEHRV
jgi:hypothetical protein